MDPKLQHVLSHHWAKGSTFLPALSSIWGWQHYQDLSRCISWELKIIATPSNHLCVSRDLVVNQWRSGRWTHHPLRHPSGATLPVATCLCGSWCWNVLKHTSTVMATPIAKPVHDLISWASFRTKLSRNKQRNQGMQHSCLRERKANAQLQIYFKLYLKMPYRVSNRIFQTIGLQ